MEIANVRKPNHSTYLGDGIAMHVNGFIVFEAIDDNVFKTLGRYGE